MCSTQQPGAVLVAEAELDCGFDIGECAVENTPALGAAGCAEDCVTVGGTQGHQFGDSEGSPILLRRPAIDEALCTARDIGLHRKVNIVTDLVGPVDDYCPRVGAIGKPLDNTYPPCADRDDRETIVGELRNLHHAGDHTNVSARLATANVAAAVDEHDTEFMIGCFDAVAHQRLVPRLEDV